MACNIKGFFINEFLFQKREISNQKIYDLLNSIHFQVRMRSIQENLNNEFYSSLGQKSDELKALFNDEDKKIIKEQLVSLVEYDILNRKFVLK